MPCEEAWQHYPYHLETAWHILLRIHPMWSPIGWLKSRNECCNLSIGLYIVLAPLYLKSVRKLQEKRFVFVKILAIIIPENGAKVSKIKCFQFAQQTLNNVNYIIKVKK